MDVQAIADGVSSIPSDEGYLTDQITFIRQNLKTGLQKGSMTWTWGKRFHDWWTGDDASTRAKAAVALNKGIKALSTYDNENSKKEEFKKLVIDYVNTIKKSQLCRISNSTDRNTLYLATTLAGYIGDRIFLVKASGIYDADDNNKDCNTDMDAAICYKHLSKHEKVEIKEENLRKAANFYQKAGMFAEAAKLNRQLFDISQDPNDCYQAVQQYQKIDFVEEEEECRDVLYKFFSRETPVEIKPYKVDHKDINEALFVYVDVANRLSQKGYHDLSAELYLTCHLMKPSRFRGAYFFEQAMEECSLAREKPLLEFAKQCFKKANQSDLTIEQQDHNWKLMKGIYDKANEAGLSYVARRVHQWRLVLKDLYTQTR